jgi:pSer/pThr/pTyr-binding forkhead associated (FHA) protein
MEVRLVSVCGDVRATEIALQLPTVVGRGRETALTLPHPLVSRRHCELYEQGGKLRVRDLGSLNGTFVGSQQVTDAEVPPGELLTVATLNFRVIYGEARAEHAAESPLLVGNDDSTFAPGRMRQHATNRPPPPVAPSPGSSQPQTERLGDGPVERETQLPAGSSPPQP